MAVLSELYILSRLMRGEREMGGERGMGEERDGRRERGRRRRGSWKVMIEERDCVFNGIGYHVNENCSYQIVSHSVFTFNLFVSSGVKTWNVLKE